MSEWISVSDRLPDRTMKVRVLADDIVSQFECDAVAYVCQEYGNVTWQDENGDDFAPAVLCWKPIGEGDL